MSGKRGEEIERLAQQAVAKHRRLLHLKTMELLLGDMIRTMGVTETRKLLTRYLCDLGEFDKQGEP